MDVLKSVVIGGAKVAYWDSGRHGAPVMLMIHGYRGSSVGLSRLGAELGEYRVIIPNLPGQGGSAEMRREHSMANYAGWLERFVAAVGLDKFYLVGHSYGCLVCLVYANEHPGRLVSPLMLVSPIPPPNAVVRAAGLYYRVAKLMPSGMQKTWLNLRPVNRIVRRIMIQTKDRRLVRDLMDEGEVERGLNVPRANIEEIFSGLEMRVEPLVAGLKVPTHISSGTQDVVTPLAEVKRTYEGASPRISFSVIEGMGHLGVEEMPGEVAADLRRAMEQTAGAKQ